tara:strand:+ start:1080 stop:2195 length:1116 start_codon:yes stop_codon:yes gene_type:complete
LNWIKIIFINFFVLAFLVVFLEIGAGIGRLILGKEFLMPYYHFGKDSHIDFDPCNEMKTDVLLDHSPNNPKDCIIKDGYVNGEYVYYKFSDKNNPILLVLGGSTSSGFYQFIAEGETYTKSLAELAKNKYFLVTGGLGGYSSLQELYKFVRDGPRFKNLSKVVSLNGINELPNYQGDDKIRSIYYPFLSNTQFSMNNSQRWVDQRVFSPLYRKIPFLPNLFSLYWYVMHSNAGNLLPNSYQQASEQNMLFKVMYAADRWEANMRRLNALVKEQGATHYLFLQPTLGLRGIQSKPKEGSSDEKLFKNMKPRYLRELRSVYKEMKKRCKSMSFCYDISDNIPPKGNFYNDARHHNKFGNKLLAEIIWDVVKVN